MVVAIAYVACAADDRNPQIITMGIGGWGGENGTTEPTAGSEPVTQGDMSAGTGGTMDIASGGSPAPDSGGSSLPEVDGGECGAVVEKAEIVRTPVDIIFGIDTSPSMVEEVAMVQENMNAFSQQIIDANIDVRVIVLSGFEVPEPAEGTPPMLAEVDGPCIAPPLGSGSCPEDSNPPTYVHIEAPVGSWNVLDVYIDQYPQYKQYLRENSLKTFVTISDDNANPETNPASAMVGFMDPTQIPVHITADLFIDAVAQLEPADSAMWSNWHYSSIYCFTKCEPYADLGAIGAVHQELVDRTQGVAGDLCLQDFQPVFDQLAVELVSGSNLACDWPIPAPPEDEVMEIEKTSVQFTLDGVQEDPLPRILDGTQCGEHDAWYYDNPTEPTRIFACPVTCERVQAADLAEVGILFGCKPPIVLQ